MIRMMWFDDARTGSGWRLWVVVTEGRKWVTLFQPGSLTTMQLTKEDYAAAMRRSREVSTKPQKLARSIRSKIRQCRRLNLPDGGRGAEAAIEALEAAS